MDERAYLRAERVRAPDNHGHATQRCEQIGGHHRVADSLFHCPLLGPHPPLASAVEPDVARLWGPGPQSLQTKALHPINLTGVMQRFYTSVFAYTFQGILHQLHIHKSLTYIIKA